MIPSALILLGSLGRSRVSFFLMNIRVTWVAIERMLILSGAGSTHKSP
jgi:hypothetical protein